METPARERFDSAYQNRTAPWVIGEPQPAVVAVERAGLVEGKVLDAGCGLGEHTILLTRLGYDVLGVDFSRDAVAQARENAAAKGVDARFEVADATDLDPDVRYDTIVDSALFHIFGDEDRTRYVASLHGALREGGVLHLLALSDAGRGFGPEVSERVVREAFADGWRIEALDTTTYRGVDDGSTVDEPAWSARIRRL